MNLLTIAAALLTAASAAATEPAGWTRHEAPGGRVSFLTPAGLTARVAGPPGGPYLLDLSSGTCVLATLEEVRYGAAVIDLPKRSSDLHYDPELRAWSEAKEDADDDEGARKDAGPVPVCLPTVALGPGVNGYAHTDAMHGWSTLVVLTGGGAAFVWSNARRRGTDYCPEDLRPLVRGVRLAKGLRAVTAECPRAGRGR